MSKGTLFVPDPGHEPDPDLYTPSPLDLPEGIELRGELFRGHHVYPEYEEFIRLAYWSVEFNPRTSRMQFEAGGRTNALGDPDAIDALSVTCATMDEARGWALAYVQILPRAVRQKINAAHRALKVKAKAKAKKGARR